MHEVLGKIAKTGIVPVIALDDASAAESLGDALSAGGVPIAEITFRTAAAEQAIRTLSPRKELLVGAGTVLNVETARRAADAGAKFIVSPGFNPKVVRWCVDNGVPITPGVATPTDIEAALEFGLGTVKFFPAEALGGLRTLKAIAAPYGMMKFIPTGGIGPENLKQYLQFPAVLACGGSWMAARELLSAGRFDEVRRLAREASEIVSRARS